MASGAGIVLGLRGEDHFLPALLVHSVQSRPRLSSVPGSGLGMAWVGGKVIPVARVGVEGSHMVVCLASGETVGLAGVEVKEAGFFPPSGDGVLYEGKSVPQLDVSKELELAMDEGL